MLQQEAEHLAHAKYRADSEAGVDGRRVAVPDLARSRDAGPAGMHWNRLETASRSARSLSGTCERPSAGRVRACSGRRGRVSGARVRTPASVPATRASLRRSCTDACFRPGEASASTPLAETLEAHRPEHLSVERRRRRAHCAMQPADGFCRRPVSPPALTGDRRAGSVGDFAACGSFRAPGAGAGGTLRLDGRRMYQRPRPCAPIWRDRRDAISQRTDQRVLAGHAPPRHHRIAGPQCTLISTSTRRCPGLSRARSATSPLTSSTASHSRRPMDRSSTSRCAARRSLVHVARQPRRRLRQALRRPRRLTSPTSTRSGRRLRCSVQAAVAKRRKAEQPQDRRRGESVNDVRAQILGQLPATGC